MPIILAPIVPFPFATVSLPITLLYVPVEVCVLHQIPAFVILGTQTQVAKPQFVSTLLLLCPMLAMVLEIVLHSTIVHVLQIMVVLNVNSINVLVSIRTNQMFVPVMGPVFLTIFAIVLKDMATIDANLLYAMVMWLLILWFATIKRVHAMRRVIAHVTVILLAINAKPQFAILFPPMTTQCAPITDFAPLQTIVLAMPTGLVPHVLKHSVLA